jgi:hypothetical protein
MEKNPVEQQNIKISAIKEEMRGNLGRLYDNREKELNNRIDDFISKLESLQKNGVAFDKEGIINGLRESADIKDREVFISHLIKILEPIIIIQATQPKVIEQVQRENTINGPDNLKLSEVLYMSINGQNEKEAEIHLAPATELIKQDGIGNFRKEVENGLKKLAEIIKTNDNIEKITATSWIVAKNPSLLERLGFTVIGEISKEEREQENYRDEKRPIAKAFMKREDFLFKYSNKKD